MLFQNLYEGTEIASQYIRFRPKYSEDVRNAIMDYIQPDWRVAEKLSLMVEVGCGSGQATNLFAPLFQQVYATDVSRKQIELARKQNRFANVAYEMGRAEDLLGVENHSVDFLLSAECVHWFDLPRFLSEVARVLKPEGCLAILGYTYPKLTPHGNGKDAELSGELTALLDYYLYHSKCFDQKRYDEVTLQFPNTLKSIPTPHKEKRNVKLAFDWTLADAKGFIRSMDCYQLYMREILESHDGELSPEKLAEFDSAEIFGKKAKDLLHLSEKTDEEVTFRAELDIFILLSKSF